MAVYDVKVYFHNTVRYEVEARDEEEAREKAMEMCQDEECPDEIVDTTVMLSDCQYTAHEELCDREEDL